MTKDIAYWSQVAQNAVKDEQAFTELYEHYFPRVYQYLLKKTCDHHLADELHQADPRAVQDTCALLGFLCPSYRKM